MKFDDIIKLQTLIKDWLEKKDIIVFSVYITLEVPKHSTGLCSISFYESEQLHDFLNLMEYDVLCNKSDFNIIDETDTVIITDLALVKLYNGLIE